MKLLQLRDVAGEPALHAAAQYDLSDAGGDGGQREAALRQALHDGLHRSHFVGRDAIVALNSGEFQLKSIRLPEMPEEELAAAIEFEARDRFELGGKQAQFRHMVAGEVRHGNEIKTEVLVFCAADELVERRMKLLESVRLNPLAVDLAPCAVARGFSRFLRRAEDANAVNTFVDIGWRGSAIIITKGTNLAFLKMVDIGGLHLTDAVARSLNITPRQALELRLRRMRGTLGRRNQEQSDIAPEMEAALHDALRPQIEKLTKDIQLCLRYYAVTFRGQRPESLTFVGGEAVEPSLTKIVSEEIETPSLIGHPLRGVANLDILLTTERRSLHPAWAVACGLGLRGTPWVRSPATGTGRKQATAV